MMGVVERIRKHFKKHRFVLASLRGRTNCVNHCIVIANGEVVFDCNRPQAESLSVASLERHAAVGPGFIASTLPRDLS